MTKDIADKVDGKAAGVKIGEGVTKGIKSQMSSTDATLKKGFGNIFTGVATTASGRFVQSFATGMKALSVGDFKFATKAFGLAGRDAGQALSNGFSVITSHLPAIASKAANGVASAMGSLGSAVAGTFARIPGAISAAATGLDHFARRIGLASFMVQNLGYELTFLATVPTVAVVGAFSKVGFAAALSLEQARAGLAPFVGGLQNAQKEIDILAGIAAKSPAFDTIQIINYAKKMQAAGLTQKKTIDLFKASSNIFSTYGLSVEQADRAMFAMTQIMQKGKLGAEELNQQLGEQIPALNLLAKAYGKTQKEVLEMVKAGKISGTQFVDAMIKVGGSKEFMDGASIGADTLKSKMQSLWEQVKYKLAVSFEKNLFPALKEFITKHGPGFIALVQVIADKYLPKVVGWFGALLDKIKELHREWNELSPSVQTFITKLVQLAIVAGPAFLILGKLGSALAALGTIASLLLTPVGLVVALVAAIGVTAYLNRQKIKDFFTESETGKRIVQNLESAMRNLKAFWDGEMIPALQRIKQWFSDVWKGLEEGPNKLGGVIEAAGRFKQTIDEMVKPIKESIQPALDDFKAGLDNLKKSFDGAGGAGKVFKTILMALGIVIGTVIAVVVAVAAGAFRLLAGIFRAVTSLIGGIIKIVIGVFKFFDDLVNGRWKELTDDLKEIWDGLWMAIVGTLFDLGKGIVEGVTTLVKTIWGWFVWLYDILVGHSVVPDLVRDVVAWFKGLPGKVITFIVELAKSIWQKFIDAKNWVVQTTKDLVDKVVEKAKDLKDRFLNAIGNLKDSLVQKGKDLVQGLIDGIQNKVEALKDKARGIADTVKNVLNGALKFGSPSKVAIQMGEWFVQGFGIGMSDTSAVAQRSAGLADAVLNPISASTDVALRSSQVAGPGQLMGDVTINIPPAITDPSQAADYTVRRLVSTLATGTA